MKRNSFSYTGFVLALWGSSFVWTPLTLAQQKKPEWVKAKPLVEKWSQSFKAQTGLSWTTNVPTLFRQNDSYFSSLNKDCIEKQFQSIQKIFKNLPEADLKKLQDNHLGVVLELKPSPPGRMVKDSASGEMREAVATGFVTQKAIKENKQTSYVILFTRFVPQCVSPLDQEAAEALNDIKVQIDAPKTLWGKIKKAVSPSRSGAEAKPGR